MNMKKDPYKHREGYLTWKEKVKDGIPGISVKNSKLIYRYIDDMEHGLNVSRVSKKGGRSYPRLNNLRQRMIFLSKKFEEYFSVDDITLLTEEQLVRYFTSMRNGTILREDGKAYISVVNYVKPFKSFWHWYMKVKHKEGVEIDDITSDLDTSCDKPKWVYLTEEEVKRMCDNAKYDYKVLILFLFDTGIRAPTELMNIKVSDLYNDFKEVHVREEVSKTFGRRMKLMICSDLIKEYVKVKGFEKDDYLFPIVPTSVNKYLQRLSKRIFGDGVSPAGKKYSELTMYHFRHCSCCYWLPRYKSESALKYRFGWKKSDKIHYYSELLGMKDTITEDDMLIDVTKTEIEKRLLSTEKENDILKDKVDAMEKMMVDILQYVKKEGVLVERVQGIT